MNIHWKDWCLSTSTLATWWRWEDCQEEKWVVEDKIVGWHHTLNEHEFEQLWEIVKDREAWHTVVNGFAKCWIWLSEWTTTLAHMSIDHLWVAIALTMESAIFPTLERDLWKCFHWHLIQYKGESFSLWR